MEWVWLKLHRVVKHEAGHRKATMVRQSWLTTSAAMGVWLET